MATNGDYDTYIAKVGRKQGADTFYGKDGGVMDLDGGFGFYFDNGDKFEASGMRRQTVDIETVQMVGLGATSDATDFSGLNLLSNTGVALFSMTSNTVALSFYLTSVVAGRDVWCRLLPQSVASGNINILGSGCSIVGYLNQPITSITLYNSAASAPCVHLHAFQDDEWSVVDWIGDGYLES